jgi:hypothetical protein
MFDELNVVVEKNSYYYDYYYNNDDHKNEDAYHALALLMVLVEYVVNLEF